MLCPACQTECRRFGKNRNGSQRYRCDPCKKSYTDAVTQPVDRRRVPAEKLTLCLRLLLEGNSIRSVERITQVHRDTIIAAMIEAGQNCKRFLASAIRNVPVSGIQADEIWAFVGCREKTRERLHQGEERGDCYTFTALDTNTKLILAWHCGKRSTPDTFTFTEKLAHATAGRFQMSTDGFRPYKPAISTYLGGRVDYGTIVKVFGKPPEERRYSMPEVVEVIKTAQLGFPDMDRACTSHIERHNLTIRMQIRRFTRLTNAHSKKWANHEAAVALFLGYYNSCRVHETLRSTPAVKHGLTSETWSLNRLLAEAGRLEVAA